MIKSPATQKGLITSAAMILVSLLLFNGMGYPHTGKSQYLIYICFMAGILWTLFDLRKKNPDARFKDYFNEGFKCFIVVTLLMTIFTFVFLKINPQILDAEMVRNNELLQQSGDRTAAEIAENEKKIRSIYMPMMLGLNIFKYLILGSLVTAISGAFMMQKK